MNNHRSHKPLVVVCGLCALGTVSLSALGDVQQDQVQLSQPVEISDSDLAELRGRFVSAGIVVYFGVQMTSQWSGPGEASASVGMSVGSLVRRTLSPDDNDKPTVRQTFAYSERKASQSNEPKLSESRRPDHDRVRADGRNASNAAASRRLDISSPKQSSGVVQRIHVAGDRNQVDNRIGMDVSIHSSASNTVSEGQPHVLEGETTNEIVAEGPGSRTVATEDGVVLQTQVDSNSLGISVDIPGQGKVVQRIGGGGSTDMKGILQSVQLAGDWQQVSNLLDLQAVLDQTQVFNASRQITPALRSLMDLQLNR